MAFKIMRVCPIMIIIIVNTNNYVSAVYLEYEIAKRNKNTLPQ